MTLFLLCDFSNAARKTLIRLKQANILGKGSPTNSYVDLIQTARRGKTTEINVPYYISRNESMVHPQDNRLLVAAQKKFQSLAGSDSNEFGIIGYRPTDVGLKRKRNLPRMDNYPRKFTVQGIIADNYPQPKTSKLKLGNIVEGDVDSVNIARSVPYPRYEKNKDFEKIRSIYYKPIFDMHSHPRGDYVPSQPDMYLDYINRKNNKGKYESLIYTGLDKKGSKDAPYLITKYEQQTPTHNALTPIDRYNTGAKWKVTKELGKNKKSVRTANKKEQPIEIKLP